MGFSDKGSALIPATSIQVLLPEHAKPLSSMRSHQCLTRHGTRALSAMRVYPAVAWCFCDKDFSNKRIAVKGLWSAGSASGDPGLLDKCRCLAGKGFQASQGWAVTRLLALGFVDLFRAWRH